MEDVGCNGLPDFLKELAMTLFDGFLLLFVVLAVVVGGAFAYWLFTMIISS